MRMQIACTRNMLITFMLLMMFLLSCVSPVSAHNSPPPPHTVYEVTPQAANGIGYTWSPEPYDWNLTVAGGATPNLIYPGGNSTLPLPFPFEFYGKIYNTVYVAEHGYISFDPQSSWVEQGEIPDTSPPNNIIAPFWSPLDVGNTAFNRWVRYQAFGQSPNRYFVIKWYGVKTPGNFQTNYNFLVVLHENNDIVFQYDVMTYQNSPACGTAGIENETGTDGLTYVDYCNQPPSTKAVRFTPVPAPTNVDAQIQAPNFVLGAAQSIARVTATYGNYGLTTASSVVITATLDHNLILQNALPVPNSLGGHVLVWDLEDLPYLATGQINLDIALPSAVVGSRYPITWTLTSAGPEEYPEDNGDITELIIGKPTFLPLILRNHR